MHWYFFENCYETFFFHCNFEFKFKIQVYKNNLIQIIHLLKIICFLGPAKFPCKKCSFPFNFKSDQERHEMLHHDIPEKQFVCPFIGCGVEIRRFDDVQNHIVTCKHKQQLLCKCPFIDCTDEQRTGTFEYVQEHAKVKHEKNLTEREDAGVKLARQRALKIKWLGSRSKDLLFSLLRP